ncbi:MAG: nucleotidyltransferase family protein [Methyloceanibacter sp.]
MSAAPAYGPGPKVAGILLAAGRSSRMAPRNKLLETIDGTPIVRRVAITALASGVRPLIAVTGFDAARVADALNGLELTIVHNPAYAEGLSTSLRAGLRALPRACDGALVCLGDMPAIENGDMQILIAAFAARGCAGIYVPVRHGRRGNPVLFGAAFFSEMMGLAGDIGAKQLLLRHRDRVTEVEIASDGIFADIDAAPDLARLKKLRSKS